MLPKAATHRPVALMSAGKRLPTSTCRRTGAWRAREPPRSCARVPRPRRRSQSPHTARTGDRAPIAPGSRSRCSRERRAKGKHAGAQAVAFVPGSTFSSCSSTRPAGCAGTCWAQVEGLRDRLHAERGAIPAEQTKDGDGARDGGTARTRGGATRAGCKAKGRGLVALFHDCTGTTIESILQPRLFS